MESIVLLIIGLGALYYVVRRIYNQQAGSCSCGSCPKAGSCQSKK